MISDRKKHDVYCTNGSVYQSISNKVINGWFMQRINQVLSIVVLVTLLAVSSCNNIEADPAPDIEKTIEIDEEGTAILPTPSVYSETDSVEPTIEIKKHSPIILENLKNVNEVLRIDGGWNNLVISHDGQYFVTWNTTNIWLFNSQNITLDPKLIFSSDFILHVSWSPVEELLAVLHSRPMGGNQLLFIDLPSGKIITEIKNEPEWAHTAAFSSDGSWLVVPTGKVLNFYDPHTGKSISRFQIIEDTYFDDIKVNIENDLIALCSTDIDQISIYTIEGKFISQKNVTGCEFNWVNNELIIAQRQPASNKGYIQIWDPVSNIITNQMEEINSKEEAIALVNEENGNRYIYIFSAENKFYKIDVNSKQFQEIPIEENFGLAVPISNIDIKFLPDGEKFMVLADSNIILYDSANQTHQEFRSPYLDFVDPECFFMDSSLIVTQSSNSINLWDVEKQRIIQSYSMNDFNCVGSYCYSNSIYTPGTSLSPDSKKILASTSLQGSEEIIILNAQDFSVIKKIEHPFRGGTKGTQSWITNEQVIVVNNYNAVILDIVNGNQIDNIEWNISEEGCCGEGHSFFSNARLSPDKSILVVTVWKFIFILDTSSKSILAKWMINTEQPITDVAWYPNSKHFVVSLQDGRITFWNIEGEKIREDVVAPNSVYGIAFSPDGDLLAYHSDINLYAINLNKPDEKAIILSQFPPDTSEFSPEAYSIAWSPDSSLIAICAQGGMAVYGSR